MSFRSVSGKISKKAFNRTKNSRQLRAVVSCFECTVIGKSDVIGWGEAEEEPLQDQADTFHNYKSKVQQVFFIQ